MKQCKNYLIFMVPSYVFQGNYNIIKLVQAK